MEEVPAQKIAKTKENPAVKAYSDSLSALSASYFAYFRLWDDLNIPAPRRVRPNPAFYKLFVPPTYYEAPIKEIFEWESVTLHLQLYINCPIWKPWPLPTVGRIIY